MAWTHFWDMHSGGRQKEKFAHCFIEAPEDEARAVFYHRFGHNPERVTCTCCGPDYSIHEVNDPDEMNEYRRGKVALTIKATEIQPDERHGEIPEEGYVWK